VSEVDVEEAVALSAQHVAGEPIEEDGELIAFRLSDGDSLVVDLEHEIGDPDAAAQALLKLADKLRAHAADLLERGYGRRVRTSGWT
jgi:hypothetical protein